MTVQTNQNELVIKKPTLGNSYFFKVLTVAFLVLLLWIPTLFVGELISERAERFQQAGREIASKWGGEQTISGVLIAVPYKIQNVNADKLSKDYLHIVPKKLSYNTNLDPIVKERGIYESVVYDGILSMNGEFEINSLGINRADLDWGKATLVVGVSDMKGIYGDTKLTWNGAPLQMQRTTGGPKIPNRTQVSEDTGAFDSSYSAGLVRAVATENGLYAPVNLNNLITSNAFSIDIPLKGSGQIYFWPTGLNTEASVESSWTNPSFDGYFLPDSSDDDGNIENGFVANWKISEFNSAKSKFFSQTAELESIADQSFGVKFRPEVDFYQKSERSVKYAILFILLTFVTFFCFEILGSKKRIHPIQYIFIGLALVIFYILLIALAEYVGFEMAYLGGAVATIALITTYSYNILKSKKLAAAVFSLLTFIYIYLYTLLQMEENSLLIGAISLFLVLATIMFVTRNVDWYLDSGKESSN